MRCLTIDVALEEPVLCTQLDGEPNSARTYGFVPGSVLRGALAAAYAAANGLTEEGALLADADARQAFFSPGVRYLNAHPLVGGVRSLPASQAWFRDKHEYREKKHDAPIYDVFVAAIEKANKRVAGEDDTFVVRSGDRLRLHTAPRQSAIHTMRDRVAGRARSDFGAVFRYEALAPRQTLRAHVLIDETGAKVLNSLLNDGLTIMLGKSRTAGYGRAQARLFSDEPLDEWNELGEAPASVASDHKWRLTLLSDALVRDDAGRRQVSDEAMRTALADVLGIDRAKIEVRARYVAARTTGGFSRVWGLPLSQSSAARMGSEYEVVCAELTIEHARRLEQLGVGDRRSEGFGRVAFRPMAGEAILHERQEDENDKAHPSEIALVADSSSAKLASVMVERMLRQLLDRKVVERAMWISEGVKRPTVSQLKRLQAVVRDELVQAVRAGSQGGADGRVADSAMRLKRYLDSVNQRPSIKRQFDAGRLPLAARPDAPTVNLQEWLEKRFSEDDDGLDAILGVSSGDMPAIGGVKAHMTKWLRREYSLRLVHAVLGLAAKRQRRNGEERR